MVLSILESAGTVHTYQLLFTQKILQFATVFCSFLVCFCSEKSDEISIFLVF
ncbi:hypothetical protein SLEP1_g43068 [Rubroshorea leprosula]|uniref:Uncharacterized protein n=1 Tax=Rubroshorea leprosula TaxID=152421 RepID=A0AAV5LCS6_9ROSI|nr:hypothetical protein SLEP1_g43068 [Rubroshorea leprosula]